MADYVLNETNEVNRKDYGIRVARPGYNALTCADNQLLFNSNWPILQIVDIEKEELLESSGTVPAGAVLLSSYETKHRVCSVSDSKIISRTIDEFYFTDNGTVSVSKIYGCTHSSGFPPLAFNSEYISNKQGYIVITAIDISEDVDYPYTEAPLAYEGASNDYGIKSKAFYTANMPREGEKSGFGINTNLSSKLIQAVKTYDTATEFSFEGHPVKRATWAPDKDENGDFITGLEEFEYFAFAKYDGIYEASDGVGYYPQLGDFADAECVYAGYDTVELPEDSSLVVLRSPMVSPEIVEVTYGV